MRKLSFALLAILATKIISTSVVTYCPTFHIGVSKTALPTDNSLNAWCVVTGTDRSTVKNSEEVIL